MRGMPACAHRQTPMRRTRQGHRQSRNEQAVLLQRGPGRLRTGIVDASQGQEGRASGHLPGSQRAVALCTENALHRSERTALVGVALRGGRASVCEGGERRDWK